jgi:hypothetical protein
MVYNMIRSTWHSHIFLECVYEPNFWLKTSFSFTSIKIWKKILRNWLMSHPLRMPWLTLLLYLRTQNLCGPCGEFHAIMEPWRGLWRHGWMACLCLYYDFWLMILTIPPFQIISYFNFFVLKRSKRFIIWNRGSNYYFF